MNIVLIGFMATGKSTVGRSLGRKLGLPFVDMDRELQKRLGMSIPQYFDEFGEEQFRREETGLLESIASEIDLERRYEREYPPSYILSSGGGVPLRSENQELLRRIGHVVWLRASPETIVERCRPQLDRRPLLAGHENDLGQHIITLLSQREPFYESAAHSVVWTDTDSTPELIAGRIKSKLIEARVLTNPISRT